MFTSLEDLRVKLVDRGVFLKQLNSKISSDQIKYSLTLENEVDKDKEFSMNGDEDYSVSQSTQLNNGDKKKNSRPLSKNSDLKSKSKNSTAKNQKKNQKAKVRAVSVVLPVEKSVNPLTFEGRIEQIRQDLLNGLLEKATSYYASFKTRSFPITRPDQIPATQQELVNMVNEKWGKVTEKVPSILAQSNAAYKLNVILSTEVFQKAERSLFEILTNFFIAESDKASEKVFKAFENDFETLKKLKFENQQKMNPRFAEANNFTEFNKLFLDEEERNKKEKNKIQNFTRYLIECEKTTMTNFISSLPLLTRNLFSMLDKVPLIDDLKSGHIEKVERKSMRQLMREKKRLPSNGSTASNRPFSQHNWPPLNSSMQPLTDFINSASSSLQLQIAAQVSGVGATTSSTTTALPSANESAKSKKKKKTSNNNLTAKSDKNSVTKLNSDLNKSNDKFGDLVTVYSFDTQLHRFGMLLRKESYENYENRLRSRIQKSRSFVDGLNKENEEFEKSWIQKVKELNPEFKPDRMEKKEERPPSSLS